MQARPAVIALQYRDQAWLTAVEGACNTASGFGRNGRLALKLPAACSAASLVQNNKYRR